MRPVIRTKDDLLLEQAVVLRSVAFELEQLAGEPSRMPPPPLRPKISWHESIRAKRVSLPAAGGWAAAIALAVELVRVVLEHAAR